MWLTGRLMPDFKTIANFRKAKTSAAAAAGRFGSDEGLKPHWRPAERVAQHRGSRTCPNQ
jgi:hypothetical protein